MRSKIQHQNLMKKNEIIKTKFSPAPIKTNNYKLPVMINDSKADHSENNKMLKNQSLSIDKYINRKKKNSLIILIRRRRGW